MGGSFTAVLVRLELNKTQRPVLNEGNIQPNGGNEAGLRKKSGKKQNEISNDNNVFKS
jgi:hypothetical protein